MRNCPIHASTVNRRQIEYDEKLLAIVKSLSMLASSSDNFILTFKNNLSNSFILEK